MGQKRTTIVIGDVIGIIIGIIIMKYRVFGHLCAARCCTVAARSRHQQRRDFNSNRSITSHDVNDQCPSHGTHKDQPLSSSSAGKTSRCNKSSWSAAWTCQLVASGSIECTFFTPTSGRFWSEESPRHGHSWAGSVIWALFFYFYFFISLFFPFFFSKKKSSQLVDLLWRFRRGPCMLLNCGEEELLWSLGIAGKRAWGAEGVDVGQFLISNFHSFVFLF